MYGFSPNDYTELGKIRNGAQVDDGQPREVQDRSSEGGQIPDPTPAPPPYVPIVNAENIAEIAKRLQAKGTPLRGAGAWLRRPSLLHAPAGGGLRVACTTPFLGLPQLDDGVSRRTAFARLCSTLASRPRRISRRPRRVLCGFSLGLQ